MVVLALLLAVANYFFGGFVFMKVWNWFPVELFNLPSLGITGALGLMLLMFFFKNHNHENSVKENAEAVGFQLGLSVVYAIILLFGFILQAFI